MLAERGRALEDSVVLVHEADRLAIDGDVEGRIAGLADDLVVVAEVLVDLHHVAQVFDGVGGDPGGLKSLGGLPFVLISRPIADDRVEFVLVRLARRVGAEAFSRGQIW